jgi:hypothetical protein
MRQVPTWTLVEFWCGCFQSHPTLPLICPRSPGYIHPSMLTHEANCRGRGERGAGALVQPAKWRPEVSSCRLMTAKSSIFIPCIYLTTLTHFEWTSGVRIASYSRQFKCIRSNRIFEGGGAALFHPAKWRPEVSFLSSDDGQKLNLHPMYLSMWSE